MGKRIILVEIGVILAFTKPTILFGQIEHPVHWSYSAKKTNDHTAEIFIKASIEKGWHIYVLDQAEGGPVKTSFDLQSSDKYRLVGKVNQPQPKEKFEKAFNMHVRFFEKTVIFHQKMILTSKDAVVIGKITFMTCNNQKCLPPDDVGFSIPVK